MDNSHIEMALAHVRTDYSISPGDSLDDFLGSRDVGLKDFADRCGISIKMLHLLIADDRPITDQIATVLARELNTDPQMWMDLQAAYNLRKEENYEVDRQMDR